QGRYTTIYRERTRAPLFSTPVIPSAVGGRVGFVVGGQGGIRKGGVRPQEATRREWQDSYQQSLVMHLKVDAMALFMKRVILLILTVTVDWLKTWDDDQPLSILRDWKNSLCDIRPVTTPTLGPPAPTKNPNVGTAAHGSGDPEGLTDLSNKICNRNK
ncbi:hypothetical protein Taro_047664, partial [Colocasia esculenta]|nr:hypothetical protein [Colocasia esculenta]